MVPATVFFRPGHLQLIQRSQMAHHPLAVSSFLKIIIENNTSSSIELFVGWLANAAEEESITSTLPNQSAADWQLAFNVSFYHLCLLFITY